jgi:hypothetical protein
LTLRGKEEQAAMSVFSSIKDAILGERHHAKAPRATAPDEAPRDPRPHLIDVENHLDTMPGADHLDWRTSIVDLMTLIGVDSSLDARIALAQELGYPGPADGSRDMDNWLHRRTMRELANHGGEVPPEFT